MAKLGIIANPRAGQDVRRIYAHCRPVGKEEKADALRRLLAGAGSVGEVEVYLMPDAMGVAHAAVDGFRRQVRTNARVHFLDMPVTDAPDDSERAAQTMRELGVACLITLGGDGTNRAVARGCGDVPLIPISTGTNNVFPSLAEATVVGVAGGLIACGRVDPTPHVRRAKQLNVRRNGEVVDIALVDLAVCRNPFIGSRAIADVRDLTEVVVTQGLPTFIGLSAMVGAVMPVRPDDQHGAHLVLGDGGWIVKAPVLPGVVQEVAVRSCQPLRPGQQLRLGAVDGTIALDGERHIMINSADEITVELVHAGPRVVDFRGLLYAAASAGLFVVDRNGRDSRSLVPAIS
jgi:predicted polyphosphate/ATP-dependent NAD kinase